MSAANQGGDYAIDFAPRDSLHALQADLSQRYWQDVPVEVLIEEYTAGVDAVLSDLFARYVTQSAAGAQDVALFAVGGYGRGELHPRSDIDLLVVAAKPQRIKKEVEDFLHAVFDLNLEIGYAVRDIKSCRSESKKDITVATAMFERRFLTGDTAIRTKLDKVMSSSRLWPIAQFYRAKVEEQDARHREYDNTEYNLEPNVKTSPGGLRDIHTTLWLCKRQFDTTDPNELVRLGVLTEQEANWLVGGRRFIWWVRFGLHLLADRKEDQLQFAYQRELSQRLGFVDTDAKRGVEAFMNQYYRHVLALTEVNDILLQYFAENVVGRSRKKVVAINERFEIVDSYIQASTDMVFQDNPSALLELFVIIASREDIKGVRASTIRLVRDHLHLIDDAFRNDPANAELFLKLLKSPHKMVSQLNRMRRYGVLGLYIPEFGRVVGQMQHDLFHIYTVDAHTLAVLRNMRLFRYRKRRDEFPVAYHCVRTVPKIELLYIAGLFHDIGKGRGGDHSVLGAVDARKFCQRMNLSEADTDLVDWLVRKHLYMSTVSQRQDIYDPEVVHQFAAEVKSERRLDYLYALTVADINATNPTLWNSWRATLMRQLYTETRRVLRRGLESPADKAASVAALQEQAIERLLEDLPKDQQAECKEQVLALWQTMGDGVFLRHSARQTAEITRALLAHNDVTTPYITILDTVSDLPGEGATQIHVYTVDRPQLFARTVIALSGFELSVVDAIVHTDESGMCFDSYTVLTADGQPLSEDPDVRDRLRTHIRNELKNHERALKVPTRRLSRQLRELPIPTQVEIQPNPDHDSNVLTIIANDRPGLLAQIAVIFIELGIQILSARIATLGERVEDTFIIQNEQGEPFAGGETSYTLTQTLRQRIDAALRT